MTPCACQRRVDVGLRQGRSVDTASRAERGIRILRAETSQVHDIQPRLDGFGHGVQEY